MTKDKKDEPNTGRFFGDMRGVLSYSPGERKPYRVEAYVWRDNSNSDEGWYRSHKMGFGIADQIYGGFDQIKSFRTVERATEYLADIRATAERRHVHKLVSKQRESSWKVIA